MPPSWSGSLWAKRRPQGTRSWGATAAVHSERGLERGGHVVVCVVMSDDPLASEPTAVRELRALLKERRAQREFKKRVEEMITWGIVLMMASFFAYQCGEGRRPLRDSHNSAAVSTVVAMIVAVFVRLCIGLFSKRSDLDSTADDVEIARTEQSPTLARITVLQRSAVTLHAEGLATEIRMLKLRALWAYVFGIVLCTGSSAGPYAAWLLANAHPDHWEYMLGGSALALIMLAAASALLRHDTKLQDQITASKRELHYFQRVQTGLDCAITLQKVTDSAYRSSLEQVVSHLLAPPPSLEMQRLAAADHVEAKRDEKASANGKDTDGKSDAALNIASELLRLVRSTDKT